MKLESDDEIVADSPTTVRPDSSALWKVQGPPLALLLGALAAVAAYDFTMRAARSSATSRCMEGAATSMGGILLGLHAVTSSLGIRVARDAERGRPRAWKSRGRALGVACIVHALSLGAMLFLVRGC